MSFKDTIIKNTMAIRQEQKTLKTMYSKFSDALKIEELIINASQKGEGYISIQPDDDLYFHLSNNASDFALVPIEEGSICSLKYVLRNPLFVDFLINSEMFKGFDIYENLMYGLVIKWCEDSDY